MYKLAIGIISICGLLGFFKGLYHSGGNIGAGSAGLFLGTIIGMVGALVILQDEFKSKRILLSVIGFSYPLLGIPLFNLLAKFDAIKSNFPVLVWLSIGCISFLLVHFAIKSKFIRDIIDGLSKGLL